MYLLDGNEIKPGQVVRHVVCDNDLCIKPSHLWAGSYADNIQDMLSAQRGIRLGIEKFECKRGHDLDKPNAIRIIRRKGRADSRACRECEHLRARNRRSGVLTSVEHSGSLFTEPNGEAA